MDKSVISGVVCILAIFSISYANAFRLADNDELFLRLNLDEAVPTEDGNHDVDSVVVVEPAEDDSQDSLSQKDKICLTKGCVKVAARVIQNMDESVDPCDDFYQFACGGFEKNTFIPLHKNSVAEWNILQDKVEEKMIMILEGEPDPTEPEIFVSVRNLFKSCMDTDDIEKNSMDEMKNLIKQVGGYPVVEGSSWNESAYNFQDLTLKLRNLGLYGAEFFRIRVTQDLKNSTRRVLGITEGSAGLGRENMLLGLEDKKVKAHLQHLIDTAKFLGASHEAAEKEMKDVLNLEMELAEIHKPQEYWSNFDQWFNLTTLKEVIKTYPHIPWIDLINKYIDNENITVDEHEEVVVKDPSYIKDLQTILAKTSARTKANFQISESIPLDLLNEEALRINDKVAEAEGKKAREPRWKTCLGTSEKFNIAASAMYVKKYFSSNAKQIMAEMIKNIINEFEIMLKELNWMDENTRNEALNKARMIRAYVGYPEELLNNTLVDEYYSGIHMAPKGYLSNSLKFNKYSMKKDFSKLREPVEKNDWKDYAENSNLVGAWYHFLDNSIEFSAGFLGGVFFGEDWPLYMDYGAIGMIVGHEITHGFDNLGSQFGGHGNIVNWWHPETKKKYLERIQCVIEEYGNYSLVIEGEEFHFNGVNTQGENIADIGGIKEAYRAYQRLSATFEEPEGTLPGLPYSTNQLLWLAAAGGFCSKDRPEFIKNQILNDVHTPFKFRINGPFSNMEEFSKDWNCPNGSNMNPVKKCHVW